jgi:hypothetical protein
VCADPKEVQTFRAGLKAGRNSPLVSGNFPPLVPSHFLRTQDDARKNASPSFSSIAAKGVKPGAKISLRSPSSLLPSWSETWMKNEDWIKNHHISHEGECMEPLNANTGKETRITLVTLHRQVHQIRTLVINLLHIKNSARSQITNLITKILVITQTSLAVKVPMVQIGNETARIAKTRNRRECYLKNK